MEKSTGRVALVTGANSGIGYATAKVLKEQGDTVVITGRRKEAIEKAAAELDAIPLVADQSKLGDLEQLAENIKKQFGSLDILVINAGIAGILTPIQQVTGEVYDRIMDTNTKGAFFTLSKFIPLLKDGASVIFVSSIVAEMSTPGSSVYSASKAALNRLMKTAAVELAARKIRVNAVSPGPTETEVLRNAGYDETTLDNLHGYILDRVPLKKMGTAENVGRMIAYLAGPAAEFITGSEFVMDGGMILV
jgi:NAD(P)-dependent dehydrogenase (short-subunit alcohol dehydrogenase family)